MGKDLLNQLGLNTFFPLQTAFVVDEVSNIVKEVRGEMLPF